MSPLSGALVAVTGAASGLGAATAARLAAAGARVAILDRDAARGRAQAEALGGVFHDADVTDAGATAAALDGAVAAAGPLRGAVACAGIVHAGMVLGRDGPHPAEAFERVLAVNLSGSFTLLRLAAERMADNPPDDDGGRGAVVLTASVAAMEGQRGQVAYAASKGGVAAMVLPAARDLARHGIRVNAIAPGLFATPLLASLGEEVRARLAGDVVFPKRLGAPEEFADLALWMLTARYMNGAVVRLDGGLRLP